MTDLDTAADQLYALGPAELDQFSSRRAELVAAARAAGDRDLARQIGALKKPVQAAALVNALVRSRPAELVELAKLAAKLRDAHRNLRGKQLRELSEQRQRLLGKLVALSRSVAGREVGESVLNQLRATLEAAIADEGAQAAVQSGRLTAALSYSGFGEVDVSDAVAMPRRLRLVPQLPDADEATEDEGGEIAGSSGSRKRAKAAAGEPDRGTRRRAEAALAEAEQGAEAADAALAEAAGQLAERQAAEQELAERISQLQAELVSARTEAAELAKQTASAERDHARAERAAAQAGRARDRASGQLQSLSADD